MDARRYIYLWALEGRGAWLKGLVGVAVGIGGHGLEPVFNNTLEMLPLLLGRVIYDDTHLVM